MKQFMHNYTRYNVIHFYARQHAKRVLAIVMLSVRLSVFVSRPGTDSSPAEIETLGFHRTV